MRLQVFQHVPFEGPGEIVRWAKERGHLLATTPWFDGAPAPDLNAVDGLIVMGGPMNIYEHRPHPWLRAEKEFLTRALEHGRPVVGVCLGAQLLADVLGGRVYQNPVREIGWWPVRWREAARKVPGLDFLTATSTPLHWHGDTFSLPQGAQLLASTGLTRHQAFALGPNVIGFQFHPEAGAGNFEAWLVGHAAELAATKIDVAALREEARRHGPALARKAEAVVTRWLAGLAR